MVPNNYQIKKFHFLSFISKTSLFIWENIFKNSSCCKHRINLHYRYKRDLKNQI